MSDDSPTAARWRDGADILLMVEAIAWLGVARLALALLPFRWITGAMSAPLNGRETRLAAARIARAVKRAATRVPWRAVCIHQGFAAQRMLRQRGFDSRFVYGLTIGPAPLEGHVWIILEDEVLLGTDPENRFHAVASFPDDAALCGDVGNGMDRSLGPG